VTNSRVFHYFRIATGKQQGRKVFTLQTIAPMAERGLAAGFNLHASVMSSAQDRCKLERLCRYITRSGVSEKRLAITTYRKVRYKLKTPYRDGTPGDRRSHRIFAPNSRHRSTITPSLRNKAKQALPKGQEKTRTQKHQSMTWAQRLKRVFNIDIETCEQCGGAVKVIASIDKSAGKPICTANAARRIRHRDVSNEHPLVIQKILSHLNTKNDDVVELLPHKVEHASDKSV
ncbi:MAG: hypothetical protein ACI95X_002158, partial [Paraglaciecola sp.]